jgi:hypothetical protein
MGAFLEKLKLASMLTKPSIRNIPFPVDGIDYKISKKLVDFQLNKVKDLIKFNSQLAIVAIDDYKKILESLSIKSRPNEYLSYTIATMLPLSFHLANTSWDLASQYIKFQYELFSLLALPLDDTNH